MRIRLTSASTGVGVEVGAELGNTTAHDASFQFEVKKLFLDALDPPYGRR